MSPSYLSSYSQLSTGWPTENRWSQGVGSPQFLYPPSQVSQPSPEGDLIFILAGSFWLHFLGLMEQPPTGWPICSQKRLRWHLFHLGINSVWGGTNVNITFSASTWVTLYLFWVTLLTSVSYWQEHGFWQHRVEIVYRWGTCGISYHFGHVTSRSRLNRPIVCLGWSYYIRAEVRNAGNEGRAVPPWSDNLDLLDRCAIF